MNIISIIEKKKNNEVLTEEEIDYFINGYTLGIISDAQASALLMAICINGMNDDETYYMTKAMVNSGDTLNLSSIDGIKVDKHSTGGVGDKTTLIVAPIVASASVKVAKLSGKGLGHTGGTIDKLDSISGFNSNLTEEEFIKQVQDIGIVDAMQTKDLVPADKKIYALRDVTGLAESIPLIASSIMSKKIASSASIIVIDVKVGNGALMKNKEDATTLANTMIKLGKRFNRDVVCVLTNMEEPLGYAIGNGLEIKECIDLLKGNGPKDLKKLIYTLTEIYLEKNNINSEEAKKMIDEKINSGEAYNKFVEWIEYQNGDINSIASSDKAISIKSPKDGIITKIDAYNLGNIAKKIGAGRTKKDDVIDYSVGLVLNKKVGDLVFENEELVKVYVNKADIDIKEIVDSFEINDLLADKKDLIIEIIK